ncbi:alpha/beta fold hydrolase [Sorangium sp. So ce321]|uniref:lipase family alpha/beta hydrolase n=1 Tax=Sorangium sp. So ce321 TaxID=3133300 RepID=UPI003F601D1C
MSKPPILLVHGIWDSAARIDCLRAGLAARGVDRASAFDLVPNDGRASIERLAAQLDAAVEAALAGAAPGGAVDVVGFSMGALVTRYYIQRGRGRARVRRFVSISGPHRGTLNAMWLPHEGVRQMRPDSPLLRDLAADPDPWGPVEVHVLYTPFDVMILPARSSELPGARTTRAVPVALHRWMLSDRRVLDSVAELLER